MHNITVKIKGSGRILGATCTCGLTFGRGKTAVRGVRTHIDGWSATYETEYE